jgi:cyanophycinase
MEARMTTHYYLGWFNEGFPQRLITELHKDIQNRESLVMISANPHLHVNDQVGSIERSWLDSANIMFNAYHLIDYSVPKNKARELITEASVIFLLGGDTIEQNTLLKEYDLLNLIKKSRTLVMGASAGAINMSAIWLSFESENHTIYEGIGLGDFSVLSHYDLENNLSTIQRFMFPLSKTIDIYASNKDCALRVQGESIDVLGNIYMITNGKMHKVKETL